MEGIKMAKKSSQMEEAVMKRQTKIKSDTTKSSLNEATAGDSAIRERIALKAYDLYEKRGRVHGLHTEDWLEAEQLVLAEIKTGKQAQRKDETKAQAGPKAKVPVRERSIATKPGSVLDRPRST
jgi:Protein of unknown function (DUF2934)